MVSLTISLGGDRLHLVSQSHVSFPNKQRQRRGMAAVTNEDESSTDDSYIVVDDALHLVLPVRTLVFLIDLHVLLVAVNKISVHRTA